MENPFQSISQKLDQIESRIDQLELKPQVEKPIEIEEAANFIGRSVASTYALVSRGGLPVYKKSKRLYFLKSELLQWIREGTRLSRKERQQLAVDTTL